VRGKWGEGWECERERKRGKRGGVVGTVRRKRRWGGSQNGDKRDDVSGEEGRKRD